MQSANRQPHSNRAQPRPASRFALSVVAMFVMAGIGSHADAAALVAPAAQPTTAQITTAWADTVRTRLAAQGVPSSSTDAPSDPAALLSGHRVTSWARAVEARLASHAHRVAVAGRTALAWSENGMASWYGDDHKGRRTAGGDRFNPMQLTCAHRTLPLGSKLLVTSETTGRSVVVTVNDRGSFSGRIVDLSRAAAARIGMLSAGTANVTLQQASPEAIEVAEAADADTGTQAIAAAADSDQDASVVSPPRRDQPHMPRVDR